MKIVFPDNLVYQVEKSKIEMKFAFLSLLSLFTASVAGLLFSTTQKVLTLRRSFHLSKKQTTN